MRVRWQNFRGFEDSTWIDLKPLTVLIGRNNTGKTSFYQPLLLLRQTLESRFDTQGLVTKGDLLDLGHYEDIVFARDESRSITFSLSELGNVDWPKDFPERSSQKLPNQIQITFDRDDEGGAQLQEYKLVARDGTTLVQRRRRKTGTFTISPLPQEVLSRLRRTRRGQPALELYDAVRDEMPVNCLFTGRAALRPLTQFLNAFETKRGPSKDALAVFRWAVGYGALSAAVFGAVMSALRGVSYMGPLRALPQRWYSLSGEMPSSVGQGGQFAPEILFRLRETDLVSRVEGWLEMFNFPPFIDFKKFGPDSFSLHLRRTKSGYPTNLADCGVGVSQVLPLIVQGLHARPGSLIVLEQPEIHLNPSLQARLAELLAAFIDEQQVVVETHSEHLLLRLRTLVAGNRLPREMLGVLFSDREGNHSSLRPIEVGDDGSIPQEQWPRGFFEESLTEALALSDEQARRARGD